ncbi:AAA family ATPase [Saccharopolyspora gloriosae]|uniref:AAA family ATPase n=1 Tax=Saccharopolyspora gloriosae TaxID=455344 RepID=UPI001FB643BC|nr:AAA family ATPase [Saccharopolyspora gloriosae]
MVSPRSLFLCRPGPTGADGRIHGRAEALDRIVESCTDAVPLVLVTGPAGVGRSAVLAQARDRVAERGMSTMDIPVVCGGLDVPEVVGGIPGALGAEPEPGESPWATLHRVLSGREKRVVVFLDDAQRLSPRSVHRMLGALRGLVRAPITFVCAVRTPAEPAAAPAEPIADLARVVRLRPLSARAVRGMLVDRLGAKPVAGLTETLRDECGGNPAVVRAAVDGYLRGGVLRVVDQHAHLVPGQVPEQPSGEQVPAVPGGFDSGGPALRVLRALTVLHPLRDAAPALIAEATGCGEDQVRRLLHDWCARAVVLPDRSGGFRFRIPMVAALLTARLGLFERRRISQLAVAALSTGAATAPDEHYLADRLAEAGNLIDRDRAIVELRRRADEVAAVDGVRAERWLRAAVKLCTDPALRAETLHRQVVSSARHARSHDATGLADEALRADARWLPDAAAQELRIIRVLGLAGAGDLDALGESADGADGADVVVRAAALCLLDRWREAYDLLGGNQWRHHDASTVLFGRLLREVSGALLGLDSADSEEPPRPAGTGAEVAGRLLDAVTLHTGADLVPWLEPGPSAPRRAIRSARAGNWDDALGRCRAALVAESVHGPVPGMTVLFREMATMLIARGRLNRAAAVLAEARTRNLPMPHLLLLTESDLADLLGEPERSRSLLEDALRRAAETGVVGGTAEVWRRLAAWEDRHGSSATAARCAERAGDADPAPEAVRLEQALARAVADSDQAAAAVAVEAADRDDPFGYATTVLTVAERGLAELGSLRAAYRIFGELDALLPRARMRALLPAGELGEQGRAATVDENERLLARLVAEGLSNQQLAVVLGSTEKSVEGRLSRCFKRTGYRSRTELATATVNDELYSADFA